MNTKRKLGTLILVGGLALATWAFAQTAFKADGVIQSTQGGFKFPDGSIQNEAHSSSIEIYIQGRAWSGNDTFFYCSFDVPEGKLLMIEKVSGQHRGNEGHLSANHIGLASSLYEHGHIIIPAFSDELSLVYHYESQNVVGYADSSGFEIVGVMPSSGSNVTFASCTVTGRLFDAR